MLPSCSNAAGPLRESGMLCIQWDALQEKQYYRNIAPEAHLCLLVVFYCLGIESSLQNRIGVDLPPVCVLWFSTSMDCFSNKQLNVRRNGSKALRGGGI